MRDSVFFLMAFLLVFTMSACQRCAQKAGTPSFVKEAEVKTKKEMGPLFNASNELAEDLCKRIKDCGGKWRGEDCIKGMARDIFTLLSSDGTRKNGPNADRCREAIRNYDCTMVLKYKFPEECSLIK